METLELSVFPKDKSQLKALKAFAKALNIKLEVKKVYDEKFIKKIKIGEQEIIEGKIKKLKKSDFESYLGL